MNSKLTHCLVFILLLLTTNSCRFNEPPKLVNVIDKSQVIHAINKSQEENITAYIIGDSSGTRGSGVLIGARLINNQYTYYILTARHHLDGIKKDGNGDKFRVRIHQDKTIYPLELISDFPEIDLSILKFYTTHKYYFAPIAKNLPSQGINMKVSGFVTCLNQRSFVHYSITGNLQNIQDYCKINSVYCKENANTNKYDLYYSSSTVSGMSGGPVINNFGQIIGIQLATSVREKNTVKNCNSKPTNGSSFGNSTNRLLSQQIPEEIKKSIVVEEIKSTNQEIYPGKNKTGKKPNLSIIDGRGKS
jgi:Trypsin-like peptidase domain